jgi:hypothetical protein
MSRTLPPGAPTPKHSGIHVPSAFSSRHESTQINLSRQKAKQKQTEANQKMNHSGKRVNLAAEPMGLAPLAEFSLILNKFG